MVNYIFSDMEVYAVIAILFLLVASVWLVYKTSRNYVSMRIRQFFLGGKATEEVDQNNQHRFKLAEEKQGYLVLSDQEHRIKPKSALRNPDGVIYQVHKEVKGTLVPEATSAANDLENMGFRSIAHAGEFYKTNYFRNDMEAIQKAVQEKNPLVEVLIDGVEKKIGLELMKPLQPDLFTMDLSILDRWSNEEGDGYAEKNLHEKVYNDAQKQKAGGIDQNRLMGYIVIILIVLGVISFLLVVLNSQGIIHLGGPQIQYIPINMSK